MFALLRTDFVSVGDSFLLSFKALILSPEYDLQYGGLFPLEYLALLLLPVIGSG